MEKLGWKACNRRANLLAVWLDACLPQGSFPSAWWTYSTLSDNQCCLPAHPKQPLKLSKLCRLASISPLQAFRTKRSGADCPKSPCLMRGGNMGSSGVYRQICICGAWSACSLLCTAIGKREFFMQHSNLVLSSRKIPGSRCGRTHLTGLFLASSFMFGASRCCAAGLSLLLLS